MRVHRFGWLTLCLVVSCSASGGTTNTGPTPSCQFQSLANSGGLCTLLLSCGGMDVGLACAGSGCACTANGSATGVRFNEPDVCSMGQAALTTLYSARCTATPDAGATADAATSDSSVTSDAATPADVRTTSDAAPPADAPRTLCQQYCDHTLAAMCGETEEQCLMFCEYPASHAGACGAERDAYARCSVAGTPTCTMGVAIVQTCLNEGLAYARCVSGGAG